MSLKKAFKEVHGMYLPGAEIDLDIVSTDAAARAAVFGDGKNPGELVEFLEEHRGAFVALKGLDRIEEGETADLLRKTIHEITHGHDYDVHFHDGSYTYRPVNDFMSPKK